MERVPVAANLLRPADAAPESGGDAKQLVVALDLLLLLYERTNGNEYRIQAMKTTVTRKTKKR